MKLFDVLEEGYPSRSQQKTQQESQVLEEAARRAEQGASVGQTARTGREGLSEQEARTRLQQYGPNELAGKQRIHPAAIFLAQYKDIMTVILMICTAMSVFMGEYVEAAAIAVIVLMNGVLGFVQEYRTERTLEALRGMASPMARVLREGSVRSVPASQLVPGDSVLLEAGDRVPADGLLWEAVSLECDESMLTGESIPVKKSAAGGDESGLFMGCVITKGHGGFTVTRTGMDTEMGGIASMLQEIREGPTPLQKRLAQLSKYIAAGCLIICAVVTLTGILRGEDAFNMLITGVSLAVAAVPEGLTAVVTISLALSVARMVRRKALVRRLHAVETLGCATVICSDKTGTITQNRMTATDVALPSGRQDAGRLNRQDAGCQRLLECIALCNNARIYDDGRPPFGGHTELALRALANRSGYTEAFLSQKYRRISEQPFDSTRKRMSVVVERENGERLLFVKGAFDILLERCSRYQDGSAILPLSPHIRQRILSQSGELTGQALRVMGAAYRPITGVSPGDGEDDLIFLGLIGMIDPPRPEVREAVARCRRAGIRTVMITGDHRSTALAIARQVGIWQEGDRVLTGADLDRMSLEELSGIIAEVSVFARVSPSHKLQIVRALRQRGQITAMTGDGVNDAPAVKEADIGVSMGINGTDVTKEASEIILLDDNFATLVNAVDEGRSIYQNIRKFIRYLLSCNIGEVLTMFLGMLFGMPVILFPIQILLVNLVTDGLPAIALGLEPSDPKAMSRPPRKPEESVFSHGLAFKIFFRGVLIGLSTLASFVSMFQLTGSVEHARTAALFALIFAQLIHVFECKSEEVGLFRVPFGNNKKLIAAAALSLTVLLCVLYVPFLQSIFSTVPLSLSQVLIPIGYCMAPPVLSSLLHRRSGK